MAVCSRHAEKNSNKNASIRHTHTHIIDRRDMETEEPGKDWRLTKLDASISNTSMSLALPICQVWAMLSSSSMRVTVESDK